MWYRPWYSSKPNHQGCGLGPRPRLSTICDPEPQTPVLSPCLLFPRQTRLAQPFVVSPLTHDGMVGPNSPQAQPRAVAPDSAFKSQLTPLLVHPPRRRDREEAPRRINGRNLSSLSPPPPKAFSQEVYSSLPGKKKKKKKESQLTF